VKSPFENKNIVLGVTGSIACYKAADLCSKLVQLGANVDVILTEAAQKFINPLTFKSIAHRPVITNLYDPESEIAMAHVALAQRADLVVIAPTTANMIGKLASGLADDPISLTVIATSAPLVLAPAMDANMFEAAIVQENVLKLKKRGATIVGPITGRLASGLTGTGRMIEVKELIGHLSAELGKNSQLAGRKIVVTAGGTIESIDPVRILTNRSSGKMGYAIAEAARDNGANTVLITAATQLSDPSAIEVIHVENTEDMYKAVIKASKNADALIMAAAVSDYKARLKSPHKSKKGSSNSPYLELETNPDILAEANGAKVKVGFAAETEDLLKNARIKLDSKGADLLVANDVSSSNGVFGSDTNKVTIIGSCGFIEDLPRMSKYSVAQNILHRVVEILKNRS